MRGENSAVLPEELRHIKLKIEVSKHAALLNNLFVDKWRQAGGTISDSDQVPLVLIDGERVVRHVLSVSPADAKVSEYSLKYVLSFQLKTAGQKEPLFSQKLHLQRQYTVDSFNILAKEHEQVWLTNTMRQQAIDQLVRKISHVEPEVLLILRSGSDDAGKTK